MGHLAGANPVLDPVTLPLYSTFKSALDTPGFLHEGRVLAVRLTHSYAHTNANLNFLPSSLKGADMSLYETGRALNLHMELIPVIAHYYDEYDNDRDEHKAGTRLLANRTFCDFNQGQNESENIQKHEYDAGWGAELPSGMITWINEPPVEENVEAQMAYITYGNEAGLGIRYSQAAMLIRIPPTELRGEVGDVHSRPEDFWKGIDDDDNHKDEEMYTDDEDEGLGHW